MGRGTYMLPGDTLTRDGALAFRETLSLWGEKPEKLPHWFTERFAARYQATQFFDPQLPPPLSRRT